MIAYHSKWLNNDSSAMCLTNYFDMKTKARECELPEVPIWEIQNLSLQQQTIQKRPAFELAQP